MYGNYYRKNDKIKFINIGTRLDYIFQNISQNLSVIEMIISLNR